MENTRRRRRAAMVLLLLAAGLAPARASERDPMLLIDEAELEVRMHLQAGVNAVAEQNLFWNFADTFAPTSGFDSDTRWLEGYLMPGISFTADVGEHFALYGKLSAVASGTLGTDAFDAGGTGAVTLEDAYLGLRTTAETGPFFDISFGPRPFKAGTGMLIANGGSSGFERGALKLGPRKAWEQAAILRFGQDDLAATVFYIDANELSDKDSGTKIVGTDLRYEADENRYAGLTFGHVMRSNSPYPRAAAGGIGPPTILPGARDGLSFVNAYGRANPFEGALAGFFVGGDFAYQWNPDIDLRAWGGRIQIGYAFEEMSWAPTIAYSYQTFSGDDPSTSRLERFDPLYYEGNPSSWSTGTKSSMMFLNSNVSAHQISLQVKPSEADTWTLRFAHIRANELNSPIQFGQGTRLDDIDGTPTPMAGVRNHHLADDIYLEYSRIINPNTFLTAGASISFPGKGIDSLTKENSPNWLGGFVNASSISKTLSVALAAAVPVFSAPVDAAGQSAPPLTAEQSDPRSLGWMQGFPPPEDRIIRFSDSDYFAFPKSRWTVCHFRQLMPTVNVSRGLGAPVALERKIDPAIDGVTFRPTGADKDMTWLQSLSANYTDGIVVLHKGVLVYERYSGCLTETGQHGAMSVTKSLTGLLGEMLVAEGTLDETAKVATIVPELKQSAFGDATVRQVLDMTTGLRYSEDYADPDADVWTYSAAGNPLPKPEGYEGPRSYFDYLKTVVKEGEHGPAFGYKTINSDALGWIIARASGKSMAELLSERIWSRIGAEQDAYYTVDSTGTPFAGGGLNAGLRDMARIGQLLLDDGMANGQRLIPQKAIDSIRGGGDKAAFGKGGYPALKGWSYRAMWWITHNNHGAFMARGVHGQAIYVDPTAQMIIARFSSHPIAGNAANDPTSLPAYEALADHLMGGARAP